MSDPGSINAPAPSIDHASIAVSTRAWPPLPQLKPEPRKKDRLPPGGIPVTTVNLRWSADSPYVGFVIQAVPILFETLLLFVFSTTQALKALVATGEISTAMIVLTIWNIFYPLIIAITYLNLAAEFVCREWVYYRLMEHGVLLDFENCDTWGQFLCKSRFAWVVIVGGLTSLVQFFLAEFMSAFDNGLAQGASNVLALAGEAGILIAFMITILVQTKHVRAIEKTKLITLNKFMEKWTPTEAVQYLQGLQVIEERTVKYHCLSILLACSLQGPEKAKQAFYHLDFSTLGQFEQLNEQEHKKFLKELYSRLTTYQKFRVNWRGFRDWCLGEQVADSWASNVPDIMMKEDHDRVFLTGLLRIMKFLMLAVVFIEVGGFVVAFTRLASDPSMKAASCPDILQGHLAGPGCNYNCIRTDLDTHVEPVNGSNFSASNF